MDRPWWFADYMKKKVEIGRILQEYALTRNATAGLEGQPERLQVDTNDQVEYQTTWILAPNKRTNKKNTYIACLSVSLEHTGKIKVEVDEWELGFKLRDFSDIYIKYQSKIIDKLELGEGKTAYQVEVEESEDIRDFFAILDKRFLDSAK